MPRYTFRYPYHKSRPELVREDVGLQLDGSGIPWNRNWGEPDYTKGVEPAEMPQELAEHQTSRSFPTPHVYELSLELGRPDMPHVRVRRERL